MTNPSAAPHTGTAAPGMTATVGILGTGQLGRMLALAARRMGVKVLTLGEDAVGSPCGDVAEPLTDVEAFLRRADVVTTEFENVDPAVLNAARLARPSGEVVGTCQNRAREKAFLRHAGLPTVDHQPLDRVDLAALEAFGYPAVAKTAAFGYDGKGQWLLHHPNDVASVPADAGPFVLERLVELAAELSVVIARGADGAVAVYPAIENQHRHHILDVSIAPARLPDTVLERAAVLATAVAEALGAVGVLCVEFFLTVGGELVVNEIAPRPHNSGHLTIEAAPTSQFEQQLRAACGLPLGATTPFRPAAMANLLGDLWADGEPDWAAALAVPGVSLHRYGKGEARPGRKMGHLTAVASTPAEALELVLDARRRLSQSHAGR
ncbi:MAG: 5-(carboxyamino)imidazole ribonucleotide synthase [Acidimicrobiales bacterium]